MSKKVVIAGSCRTAIGKMSGMLATVPVAKLGEIVIRESIQRAGIQPGIRRQTDGFSQRERADPRRG